MKKMRYIILSTLLTILCTSLSFAQNISVEGYAFEDDNRGYLNEVSVKILDANGANIFCEVFTDEKGFFSCEVPLGQDFAVFASKDVFEDFTQSFSTVGKAANEKIYLKLKMQRKPGYLLDVTLAEALTADMEEVDAIQGALIEIYNNTSKKEELVLKDHPFPTFQHTLEKGNHYTLMIRKEGFFTKRIEAYVDIDGCILCMDGVNEVAPGVSDNLTEGHNIGTLLANIELERAEVNKSIEIKNIYYDLNSARIKTAAAKELDKLVFLLKNNPEMIVELGSHTDARGKADFNQKLSQRRAESAVQYILEKGDGNISANNIKAKGYGETQLVNGCKDGVKCPEPKHAENRRTELKIVGYNQSKDDMRSLASIIEAEQFEVMLQEVLNQEVVEIKEGEEIPAELKKQLENQNKEKTTTEEPKETKEPASPKPSPVQQTETNRPTDDIDPFATEEEIEEHKKQAGNIVGETKITRIFENAATPIAKDYTGFKVQIWKSDQALSPEHSIFTQHGNITVGTTHSGTYSYMLGDFDNYEAAFNYLRQTLILSYPEGKVIEYKEGNRLDF